MGSGVSSKWSEQNVIITFERNVGEDPNYHQSQCQYHNGNNGCPGIGGRKSGDPKQAFLNWFSNFVQGGRPLLRERQRLLAFGCLFHVDVVVVSHC